MSGFDTPAPDADMARQFALALCREGTFRCLDVDNKKATGFMTAEQAVHDRRAYFGELNPWVAVLDDDTPSRAATKHVVPFLSGNELEYLEVDSGRNRHVFVYLRDEHDRGLFERLKSEVKQAGLKPDWRRSGHIRPPLSPHRFGGWSWPVIGVDEALETVIGWAKNQQHPVPVAAGPCAPLVPLPLWVSAWESGDEAEAVRIGKPMPPHSEKGRPDVNRVDAALALAYRNSGRSREDFVSRRRAGGGQPSPRALEAPDGGVGYLNGQWDFALGAPEFSPRSVDVRAVVQLVRAEVEASELSRSCKLILAALCSESERLNKLTLDLSRRDLLARTGLSSATLVDCFKKTEMSRFVNQIMPQRSERYTLAATYCLQAPGQYKPEPHITDSGVSVKCGSESPLPYRDHPYFTRRGSALSGTEYDVLLALKQPADRRQARKLRGRVDRRTFDSKVLRLLELGLLQEEPSGLLSIRHDLDWDRMAINAGAIEAVDAQRRAIERERAAHSAALKRPPSPRVSAARQGGAYEPEMQTRYNDELSAATAEAEAERLEAMTSTLLWLLPWRFVAFDGQFFDATTGEAVGGHGLPSPPAQSSTAVSQPGPDCPLRTVLGCLASMWVSSVTVRRPVERANLCAPATGAPSGCCVGCGHPAEVDPMIGHRLHDGCTVPHWIAPSLARLGPPIPPDRIRPKPSLRSDPLTNGSLRSTSDGPAVSVGHKLEVAA